MKLHIWKHRIFVSETFVVTDCIYFDPVTSDTTSNYYINSNNVDISYNDGYIVITSKNTGREMYVDLRSISEDIKGKTVNFEVEVDTNGITGIVLRTYNITPTASMNIVNGVNLLENVSIPSDANLPLFRITKTNSTSGQSFKIKNIKVYPI